MLGDAAQAAAEGSGMSDDDRAYSYQGPDENIYRMLTGGGGTFGLFPSLQGYMADQFRNMGMADTNPYTYSGERIADFSPREEYAMEMADAGIGSYLPYLQRSHGLMEDALATTGAGTKEAAGYLRDVGASQYDPATAYQEYMDPYEDAVVQQSLEDLDKAYTAGDIGRRATEVGSGAFGGARSQLAQRDADEDFQRGAMREVANIRSRGYGSAQQQAQGEFARQQQARMAASSGLAGLAGQLASSQMGGAQGMQGLGGLYQSMSDADIGRMMNIGGMNRARNQALMDLNYQNFVGQYNLPMQLMTQYGNMLSGAGPLAGGYGYSGGDYRGASNFYNYGPQRDYFRYNYGPSSNNPAYESGSSDDAITDAQEGGSTNTGDIGGESSNTGGDAKLPGTGGYGGSTDTSGNTSGDPYDENTGPANLAHGGRVRGSSGQRFPLSARRMGIMSLG
jgi:hypothetical protein